MKLRIDTDKHEWNFEKLVEVIRQVHEELAAQAGRGHRYGAVGEGGSGEFDL